MGAADHQMRPAPGLRPAGAVRSDGQAARRHPRPTRELECPPGRPDPRRHRRVHVRSVPGPPSTARTARLLAALLLVLASIWVLPAPAYACSCVHDQQDPELVRRAEVIFTGTLIGDRSAGQTRTLTFAVERVYKGQATATQEIKTGPDRAACGLELAGSGPFLIQAGSHPNWPGALLANLCGGSRAAPDPASLGAGYPPQPNPAPTALTWTPTSATATLVIGVAFLGIALLIVRRRSGRPEG